MTTQHASGIGWGDVYNHGLFDAQADDGDRPVVAQPSNETERPLLEGRAVEQPPCPRCSRTEWEHWPWAHEPHVVWRPKGQPIPPSTPSPPFPTPKIDSPPEAKGLSG
ncbi:MAG: hypothetical protein KatS3mg113_1131 [Planctomycetaceae bacterium]|nr:MAG: hypothetical protein KatS3mg113_1131 [Planctomycetaceae bacterium]